MSFGTGWLYNLSIPYKSWLSLLCMWKSIDNVDYVHEIFNEAESLSRFGT